jgi:hypothetical protein
MKRLLIGFMILMGVMITAMPMAIADPMGADPISVGDSIYITQEMGNAHGGGAFNVDKAGDIPNQGILFDTFCVEFNEHIAYQLYIGGISTEAILGGGGPNPDPISSQTAYLYYQWRTGAITHTEATANDLQIAIWHFEQELYPFTELNVSISSGAQGFIDAAIANAIEGELYGVRVMNLYGFDANGRPDMSIYKQDMLVYVPEPGTLLLLGLGLIGLGFIKRKKL